MSFYSHNVKQYWPLGALLIAILLLAPAAGAEIFVVNTTDDGGDINRGDGRCDAGQGACTLRAAIHEANADPASDTVVVPAGMPPFELTKGVITIRSKVVIEGNGNQILCTKPTGISLEIQGDGVLTLLEARISECGTGLSLESGAAAALYGVMLNNNGTGVYNLGGHLRASGSLFVGGSSSRPGAAIRNRGHATVDLFSCELNYNHSGDRGGAIHNEHLAQLFAQLVVFRGNTSGDAGGAIFNEGRMTLDFVRFDDNRAPSGGAIENAKMAAPPPVVTRSSFVKNLATGEGSSECGGAIRNSGGNLHVMNSTISNNLAFGNGAGVCARFGTVELTSSTVASNVANFFDPEHDDTYGDGGGTFSYDPGYVVIRNSIVAENLVQSDAYRFDPSDCHGQLASRGFSLVRVVDERCTYYPEAGDLIGSMQDPMEAGIDELTDHWYTAYHPVLGGSPVIDTADPAGCIDPLTLDKLRTDQLEYDRHTNGKCDRGAVEYQP